MKKEQGLLIMSLIKDVDKSNLNRAGIKSIYTIGN